MTCRLTAASAAVLLALGVPAHSAKITQLSPSIILLGEPAAVEPTPEKTTYRGDTPDILAGGERREAGVARTPVAGEPPVAEDETTAAVEAPDEPGSAGLPPGSRLEDSELRLGQQ